MKLSRRHLLGLLFLFLVGCTKFEPPHIRVENYDGRQVRVACVGDSITYGAGVQDRETNNYPSQLAGLLGDTFEVRNFGRNGATLSTTGDLPYKDTEEFQAATDFLPDVIILKLGTNDTKPQNWKGTEAFEADLRAMLAHFTRLKNRPRPKVWVCLPVPVYEDKWGINAATLDGEILPAIMNVCNRQKVPIIDLHDALTGHPEYFDDGVHPNARGAALMAQTVYQAIRP